MCLSRVPAGASRTSTWQYGAQGRPAAPPQSNRLPRGEGQRDALARGEGEWLVGTPLPSQPVPWPYPAVAADVEAVWPEGRRDECAVR